MLRTTLFVLIVPALLAGCFEGDPAQPASEGAVSSASEPAHGEAPGRTGDENATSTHDNATASDDGSANAGDAEAPAPRVVAVAEPGELGAGAEACQSDDSSMTCVAVGDTRWGKELDLQGAVATAFELTLSWEPVTPATAMLAFTISMCDVNDGCTLAHLQGPSPLTHTGTLANGLHSVAVYVSPMPQGGAGVGLYPSTPQAFSIDGSLTLVDSAAAPASA